MHFILRMSKDKSNGFNIKDYILYFVTVILLLLLYLYLGNFGNIFEPVSQSTEKIAFIYKVTYYAAGVIFSLFVGALIYFTLRFWDRGEKDGVS